MNSFERELETLINRYSKENGSDTPDFILASYLNNILENANELINWREQWYGRSNNNDEFSDPEPVGEGKKDNCPCCNYPDCDHDHAYPAECSKDYATGADYGKKGKQDCFLIYYYSTISLAERDKVEKELKRSSGLEVISIYDPTRTTVETVFTTI